MIGIHSLLNFFQFPTPYLISHFQKSFWSYTFPFNFFPPVQNERKPALYQGRLIMIGIQTLNGFSLIRKWAWNSQDFAQKRFEVLERLLWAQLFHGKAVFLFIMRNLLSFSLTKAQPGWEEDLRFFLWS